MRSRLSSALVALLSGDWLSRDPLHDSGASRGSPRPRSAMMPEGATLPHSINRPLWRYPGRLRRLFQKAHDAILLVDVDRQVVIAANRQAARWLGRDSRQLRQCALDEIHNDNPDSLQDQLSQVCELATGQLAKLNYRLPDGSSRRAVVSLSPVDWDRHRLVLCIARDDEESEQARQHMERLAYHDTLTGLPNRALLTDRINHALARARRTSRSGALLFLDLDKFKRINDSLGHAVGDALLKGLATRLQQTLREEDTIARLGGDEFVVLLESLGSRSDEAIDMAQEIAEKLRQSFNRPFVVKGHELYVTSSIGIVTFPHDGNDVDTLLRHADTAMYHAKGSGRDSAHLFERRMDEVAMSRLRYEQDLRKGLVEGQFALHFQPVQAICDRQPLGAEALLRWHHPTRGLIAPSEFLPYIENSALMLQLSQWVLHEACRIVGELQNDPDIDAPKCIGINIGHQQFEQPDFVEQVRATLTATGADPSRLQIEITETLLIRDDKAAVERMRSLRELGVHFALDDFGTGYSSLSDLRRLPIETLKIDRSLVRDVAIDAHDEAIVRAILSMADHIGLKVVAEGVETREQLKLLRDARCTYYQGFLGRPPVDAETFREELVFQTRDAIQFGVGAQRADTPPPPA